MIDPNTLGANVAGYRRRRGLSQAELAALLDRSLSWVSQVERGVRVVDRVSVLDRIAEVLEVSLAELLGQPSPLAGPPERDPAVQELRALLCAPTAPMPAPEVSLRELQERVAAAWELAHAARYHELGQQLTILLPQLHQAARALQGKQQQRALELLARAYHTAVALFAKVGESDAAWVAADRAISAAERAGDPLLAAAGAHRLGLAFVATRQPDLARQVATAAATALAPHQSPAPPERWSLWGALHLVAATAAARANDVPAARQHIAQAGEAARQLGQDRNDFDTEFGPTNVALQSVAVEVELGNAGEALRLAEGLDTTGLSPERRARLLMYLASAYMQRRRAADAVRALLEAEELTPEQVRSHVQVRRILADLLRTERPGAVPGLTELAERARVA